MSRDEYEMENFSLVYFDNLPKRFKFVPNLRFVSH